ncbi:hypothetical protein CSPHI_09295 [Corynebacterium sphenisci DSM 44792]|uniref:Peptidase S1 domain-containing protein n=1 Tax=Corynebacterium sphenisci DSM 44792 TaxID=1437874 RepID=A0A1L7CZ64_9CORY|nr:serine protease [Corynebacterium sphenisci]APT91175.1 hypothetical protein CSPHI_09295 [Corynebacterium sphenisci DSM 44792]
MRPRTRIRRLIPARLRRPAAAALAAALLALPAGPAAAEPQVDLRDYGSIAPGTMFYNLDRADGRTICTFGFQVLSHADPGLDFATAGHCGDPGDRIGILHGDRKIEVGHVRYANPGDAAAHGDIGVVRITDPAIPYERTIAVLNVAPDPVPGDAAWLRAHRPTVCKVGVKTGLGCGPWHRRNGSFDDYRMLSIKGDSGSPVFLVTNSGAALPVGILTGSPTDLGEEYMRFTHLEELAEAGWEVIA